MKKGIESNQTPASSQSQEAALPPQAEELSQPMEEASSSPGEAESIATKRARSREKVIIHTETIFPEGYDFKVAESSSEDLKSGSPYEIEQEGESPVSSEEVSSAASPENKVKRSRIAITHEEIATEQTQIAAIEDNAEIYGNANIGARITTDEAGVITDVRIKREPVSKEKSHVLAFAFYPTMIKNNLIGKQLNSDLVIPFLSPPLAGFMNRGGRSAELCRNKYIEHINTAQAALDSLTALRQGESQTDAHFKNLAALSDTTLSEEEQQSLNAIKQRMAWLQQNYYHECCKRHIEETIESCIMYINTLPAMRFDAGKTTEQHSQESPVVKAAALMLTALNNLSTAERLEAMEHSTYNWANFWKDTRAAMERKTPINKNTFKALGAPFSEESIPSPTSLRDVNDYLRASVEGFLDLGNLSSTATVEEHYTFMHRLAKSLGAILTSQQIFGNNLYYFAKHHQLIDTVLESVSGKYELNNFIELEDYKKEIKQKALVLYPTLTEVLGYEDSIVLESLSLGIVDIPGSRVSRNSRGERVVRQESKEEIFVVQGVLPATTIELGVTSSQEQPDQKSASSSSIAVKGAVPFTSMAHNEGNTVTSRYSLRSHDTKRTI